MIQIRKPINSNLCEGYVGYSCPYGGVCLSSRGASPAFLGEASCLLGAVLTPRGNRANKRTGWLLLLERTEKEGKWAIEAGSLIFAESRYSTGQPYPVRLGAAYEYLT